MNKVRTTLAAAAATTLVSAVLVAGMGESASAATTGRVDVAAGNTLSIRNAPSGNAAKVGSYADGASIAITCKVSGTSQTGTFGTTNQWDRVASGYVSHAYVSSSSAIPACTTAPPAPSGTAVQKAVVAKAKSLVGKYPYVKNQGGYYGPTNGGFDCSGLTMYAWYQGSGGRVKLTHWSKQQYNEGASVPFSQRQPGDLMFKSGSDGIYHVVVYVGNNQYVGAQSPSDGIRLISFSGAVPSGYLSTVVRPRY
ncbi:C40 family peptidase [Luteipulveratus mongoliensis]|uniref:C40 family peptidase n=1 Tax=Luteipulveratus mongoliensis TaxID=571913 RepID=UPI000695D307|nr:NlpC/P60 family protein [Luteipulveratus mongoliensis]